MEQDVNWPAMIHCDGDDELTYVADWQSWLADKDLSSSYYGQTDHLIDSDGKLFSLTNQFDGIIKPLHLEKTKTLAEVADLLRKHFSVSGTCCISKIQPDSIATCLAMLREDQNESDSHG